MLQWDLVTVTYQNQSTLNRFLAPWLSDDQRFCLWVVDNGSKDTTVAQLKAQLKNTQYEFNADNRGYASAANQGASMGYFDYIVFINPDCFAGPDDIEPMVEYLRDNPQTGLAGCRVLNEDGHLQPASCRRLPTFWRVFIHMSGLYRLGLPGINKSAHNAETSGYVEAVNGALFVVRRDLFEQLGGFDTGFPLHFEDLDLMRRCLNAGYRIHYQADVRATHLKGQSSTRSDLIKQWKKQGIQRYFSKHRPRWEQWILNRLLVLF